MNDQVTPAETTEILRLAGQCLAVPGDFVELGCYRGGTSVLLGQLLQNSSSCSSKSGKNLPNCGKPVDNLCKNPKNLWIYDSFAGLPAKTAEDSSSAGRNFQKGELLVTKREVVAKLRRHGLRTASHPDPETSTVIIKKAWFDQLTSQDLPREIAFAFLDGDFYASIQTSLQLVQPRLAEQGIIVVHDYNNPQLPGSTRAVDEFLRAHPNYRPAQRHTLAILTRKC